MRIPPIDLRSDTVTKPTSEMRRAMAEAEVGDDVLGDDPTVAYLESRVAKVLGKESALYVPSGTMSNLAAVRTHCRPGDEMICEAESHVVFYEQGGYAQLAGVAARCVAGERGVLGTGQVSGLIRPNDAHFVRTRLLWLENTHNRGGGSVQPFGTVAELCRWGRENELRTHLDGARLWNAEAATGIEASRWAEHFDTVSVCFSKGLGAPVGSALVGSRELIDRARRHRKVLGGGMRQAGITAAGALYALEHHRERLTEDHRNATRLAEGLGELPGLSLPLGLPQTNILFVDVSAEIGPAVEIMHRLEVLGVRVLATGPTRLRAVTHLDIRAEAVETAISRFAQAIRR